jgi:hypothetical protein
VFQLVFFSKTASSEVILQEAKSCKTEGAKSGLYWMRENKFKVQTSAGKVTASVFWA